MKKVREKHVDWFHGVILFGRISDDETRRKLEETSRFMKRVKGVHIKETLSINILDIKHSGAIVR